MSASNWRVRRVGEEIEAHLSEIAGLFVPGTKLTIVARQPSHPDGSRDLVQTNDDIPAVIDALRIQFAASSSSTPLSGPTIHVVVTADGAPVGAPGFLTGWDSRPDAEQHARDMNAMNGTPRKPYRVVSYAPVTAPASSTPLSETPSEETR